MIGNPLIGTVAKAASGNATAVKPTGWQPGQFALLIALSADNVASTPPAGDGWTQLFAPTNSTTTLRLSVWYKYLSVGQADALVTHAAGSTISVVMVAFPGVNATTGFDTPSVNTGSATVTVNFGTITPSSDEALVFAIGGEEFTGNTSGAPVWSSLTGSNPVINNNLPVAVSQNNNGANMLSLLLGYGTDVDKTATGARTSTISGEFGTPTAVIGVMISLIPAATTAVAGNYDDSPGYVGESGALPSTATGAWTAGSYVVVLKPPIQVALVGIEFEIPDGGTSGTTREILFEIATGAAGSETVICQIPYTALRVTALGYQHNGPTRIDLPEGMTIAAGTPVSVRVYHSIAAATVYSGFKILYEELAAVGGTPISDSDTNGTTSEVTSIAMLTADQSAFFGEATTLIYAATVVDVGTVSAENTTIAMLASDVNGSATEVGTAAVGFTSSDSNGALTEITRIAQTASDANAVTTESVTEIAAMSTADANSTLTENTRIAQQTADVNSGVTETGIQSVAFTSVDTNGTVTENTVQSAVASSSDSGTETESATEIVLILDQDNGVASDSQVVNKILSSSDTATETENTVATARMTATDTAGDSEAGTATIAAHGSDTGSDSETTQTKVVVSDTEINNFSESVILAAKATTTDSGSDTEAAQVTTPAVTGTDSASGTESAAAVKASLSGGDTGSDAETASTGVRATSTDGGSTVEFGVVSGATFISTDSFTANEIGTAKVSFTSLDQLVVLETASYKLTTVSLDNGTAVDVAISPTIKVSAADIALTTEFQRIAAAISDSDTVFGVESFIIAYEHPGGTGEIFLGVGLRKPTILATSDEKESATVSGLPKANVLSANTPEADDESTNDLPKPGLKRVR